MNPWNVIGDSVSGVPEVAIYPPPTLLRARASALIPCSTVISI